MKKVVNAVTIPINEGTLVVPYRSISTIYYDGVRQTYFISIGTNTHELSISEDDYELYLKWLENN